MLDLPLQDSHQMAMVVFTSQGILFSFLPQHIFFSQPLGRKSIYTLAEYLTLSTFSDAKNKTRLPESCLRHPS